MSDLRDQVLIMSKSGRKISHVLRLARVYSRNADGTPKQVEILHNMDEKIKIKGGEEFITMYLPYEITVTH